MRPGFTVGAGVVEYLYIDTPEYDTRNPDNELMTLDNNFHLLRVGLSYRF